MTNAMGLRVTHQSITICQHKQRRNRILFWRKTTKTTDLAQIPWNIQPGDRITLYGDDQIGYMATINNEVALIWQPSDTPPK